MLKGTLPANGCYLCELHEGHVRVKTVHEHLSVTVVQASVVVLALSWPC